MIEQSTEARGIRNNNPLNIRYVERNKWQGRVDVNTDGEFEQFTAPYWGFRAAFILLYNYMNKYNKKTVNDIIRTWAPPEDKNDTAKYIARVCGRTDIDPTLKLDFCDGPRMFAIVTEMAVVECGKYFPAEQIMTGYVLACESLGQTPKWGEWEGLKRLYRKYKNITNIEGL